MLVKLAIGVVVKGTVNRFLFYENNAKIKTCNNRANERTLSRATHEEHDSCNTDMV